MVYKELVKKIRNDKLAREAVRRFISRHRLRDNNYGQWLPEEIKAVQEYLDRVAVGKFIWKRQVDRMIYIGEEKLFIPYKTVNPLSPIRFFDGDSTRRAVKDFVARCRSNRIENMTLQYNAIDKILQQDSLLEDIFMTPEEKAEEKARFKLREEHRKRGYWKNLWRAFRGRE